MRIVTTSIRHAFDLLDFRHRYLLGVSMSISLVLDPVDCFLSAYLYGSGAIFNCACRSRVWFELGRLLREAVRLCELVCSGRSVDVDFGLRITIWSRFIVMSAHFAIWSKADYTTTIIALKSQFRAVR